MKSLTVKQKRVFWEHLSNTVIPAVRPTLDGNLPHIVFLNNSVYTEVALTVPGAHHI